MVNVSSNQTQATAKPPMRTDDGTTVTLVISGVAFTGGGKEWRERQARLDAIKQQHLDRLKALATDAPPRQQEAK